MSAPSGTLVDRLVASRSVQLSDLHTVVLRVDLVETVAVSRVEAKPKRWVGEI